MRLFLLFSLIVSCTTAIWLTAARDPMSIASRLTALWEDHTASETGLFNVGLPAHERQATVERLLEIEPYEDLDYGFKVAIPVGWRKIVTAESEETTVAAHGTATGSDYESSDPAIPVSLEPGYAVGFESVQQNEDDRFADYILIEVLPGEESGRFEADDSLRQPVTIDGRNTWFDRLEIDQVNSGLIDVDLIVYQAELSGVGYTIGLYAIGEPIREPLLAMAFEVMLQTFKIVRDPFSVS